ncbi:MAG TPA: YtxH domain-containing protein [Chitinophagales bacterium]|nr:YtxH domain-containing protein [Chitinophagales bacterium]
MTNSQKILAAVAVGVVAGLLLAPDKGSATRKKIVDTTRKSFDSMKDFASSSLDTLSEMKEKYFTKNDGHGKQHAEDRIM